METDLTPQKTESVWDLWEPFWKCSIDKEPLNKKCQLTKKEHTTSNQNVIKCFLGKPGRQKEEMEREGVQRSVQVYSLGR